MNYFTGHDIRGLVKASTAATFKDVVDRYLSMAVPLNCTRAQYAVMDKAQRNAAKEVPYIVAATFDQSPSPRTKEHATACNLLCLDVDPDKTTGKSPASPWLSQPDILAEALSPFSFACYHTTSSTPAVPRIRIVVSAKGIEPADYPAAVQTIAKRIGLQKVTPESLNCVQAMYLPSLFKDESEHPLFLYELTGREFVTTDITGTTSEPTAPKQRNADDLIEFLRAPVEGVTLEMATAAVNALNPDIEYREWLDVAAALRHQFTGTDDEEAAFELFDTWSSRGAKYVDADETRAKWDSFTFTPTGRLPKTMRTVLQRAALAGWECKQVKEQNFQRVMHWITNGAESVSTLLSESLSRIMTAPLLSQSEMDALLHQVVTQAKRRFQVVVNVTSLRKDMQLMQQRMDAESAGKKPVPAWVQGVCYVIAHDEFFRHRTNERMDPPAFDRAYARNMIPEGEDKPAMPASQYALNTVKVGVAYGYEYNPKEATDLFTLDNGQIFVNTYRRTYPVPTPETAKEAGKLFVQHLLNLIAEKDYARTVLDICAFIVQNPGVKIRWALLLQGIDGCGKSFLKDAMSAVLGSEHVFGLNPQAIFKGWSEWAAGFQLVTLEEVRVAGQNRHDIMNALKPLITNDMVTIERRNCDTRQVHNVTNYFLFTNHHDALALTPGDRRYFVLKSKMQTREQVMALPADYFPNLYKMLKENAGGLRWFLETWKISPDFNPNGHAPATTYLQQLVMDSANDTTATVRRLITEHDHPLVQADLVSTKVLTEMLANEGIQRVTPPHLAAVLRDEGFVLAGRSMLNEERHHLWCHSSAHIADPAELARYRVANNITDSGADLFL